MSLGLLPTHLPVYSVKTGLVLMQAVVSFPSLSLLLIFCRLSSFVCFFSLCRIICKLQVLAWNFNAIN